MANTLDPVKILLEESKKSNLSQINSDFYIVAGQTLSDLENELKNTGCNSTKYALVEDKLKSSREAIESVLSQRLRKIIKQVQIDIFVKDPACCDVMTSEERELYNSLLSVLKSWKSINVDKIFERCESNITVHSEAVACASAPIVIHDDDIKIIEPPAPDQKSDFDDYIMVRIMQNIPTFVGIDMKNYSLNNGDIATVHKVNARGLIAKKAAIEISPAKR